MNAVWGSLSRLPLSLPGNEERREVAAVLVPLFEDEEGRVRLVLTKRPAHMPTHAGELAFPGGMPAATDEGPLDTALREAWEEVGIRRDEVSILGTLEPVTTATASLVVVPVVGRLTAPPELRLDPAEVEKVLDPPLEVFLDEGRWWTESWQGRELWFFEVDGEILWGATARMVRQLLWFLRPP